MNGIKKEVGIINKVLKREKKEIVKENKFVKNR